MIIVIILLFFNRGEIFMKDIRDIITFIEKNLSEELIEINSSLELLQEVLNNTNNKISYIMSEFAKNNRHEEAREFLDNSEKIYNYINILDNILNEIATISKKKREKREIPDYEKHIVDNTKVHYLNENFTYKRPYAFVIEGNMIKVNTWVQMLLETCRILIKKDENLFMTFINSSDFKGKKRAKISENLKD